MKKTYISVIAGMLIALSSCAPVYKCGEEKPPGNLAGSNRLKAVVNERDELCENLKLTSEENEFLTKQYKGLTSANDSLMEIEADLNAELSKLESDFNELTEDFTGLQKEHLALSERYSTMMTEKINQGYLYDERIKEKERRLAMKEEALKKREQEINELERVIARKDSISKRLNNLLREALLGFDADELTIQIKDGKVYVSMSDKLMFASGKAEVEDKGKEALVVLARVLKKNPEFQILVEGHTDNVPISTSKYKDNWDLSVARATSMVRLLEKEYKLEPTRLTASGRGEYEPKASNDSAQGRAKNRRTEIILSPKLDEIMKYLSE
jgi:chemotaxis protein MotB